MSCVFDQDKINALANLVILEILLLGTPFFFFSFFFWWSCFGTLSLYTLTPHGPVKSQTKQINCFNRACCAFCVSGGVHNLVSTLECSYTFELCNRPRPDDIRQVLFQTSHIISPFASLIPYTNNAQLRDPIN